MKNNQAVVNPNVRVPIVQQPTNRTGLNSQGKPSAKGVPAVLNPYSRTKPR